MKGRTLITGNTYPVKEGLKALGAKWDPTLKGWWVPTERASEARALVGSSPSPSSSRPAPTRQCWECGCSATQAEVREAGGEWYASGFSGKCYCGC